MFRTHRCSETLLELARCVRLLPPQASSTSATSSQRHTWMRVNLLSVLARAYSSMALGVSST